MASSFFRIPATVAVLALALLFSAGPARATELEDDAWVQAGFHGFFHGDFANTCADQERDALLLKRADHGPDFCRLGEFVSPEYKAGKAFDALFVSWIDECGAGDRVRLFIRVGDENKKFTEWTEMKKEGEQVYPSNHRYLQYKVRLQSSSSRTTPALKSVAIYFVDLYDTMKNLKPEPVDYKNGAAAPEIVERDAWGAAKPKEPYTPMTPEAIVIHHSYIPAVSQYQGAATIRGIQDYHMNDPATGWNDIGYHFLIGPDGKIFRGRPETALGSHCVPNTNKLGICCIGNFDPGQDALPEATYRSLKALVTFLAAKYHVAPTQLWGHRDFSPKTCPGDLVYGKLPDLRTLMQALRRAR